MRVLICMVFRHIDLKPLSWLAADGYSCGRCGAGFLK